MRAMESKKRLGFDMTKKRLIVDGKVYRFEKQTSRRGNKEHASKDVFVEVDEPRYLERVESVADYLASAVDQKKLMQEILNALPVSHFEQVERRVKKFMPVKVKDGCMYLEIGGVEIPLVD
jgi:hypothetical protein